MKLSLHHRPESLGARYAGFNHRNDPNRPHISSDTRDVKERRDKNKPVRPNLTARPPIPTSEFLLRQTNPNLTKQHRHPFRPPRLASRRAPQRRR
ncbi:hypothetical protein DL237_20185 [Pseudooceanicola sediminis]|uniref:Uncharacterized protein n=1 Tax=Pseudooceanicola sediminis TaxID=2211117 RepID=A0A399IVB4_9RHOB|nr:hypothetical protein E0K93_20930 [Puniceibacterium sp. HSS470]RII36880.1 hypothetical protein DL237_20185 [Pseudooceanicola sediminis]